MLYLVGGASRAGKSTLAERMRTRHGVPWFALDALKMDSSWARRSLASIPSTTTSKPRT